MNVLSKLFELPDGKIDRTQAFVHAPSARPNNAGVELVPQDEAATSSMDAEMTGHMTNAAEKELQDKNEYEGKNNREDQNEVDFDTRGCDTTALRNEDESDDEFSGDDSMTAGATGTEQANTSQSHPSPPEQTEQMLMRDSFATLRRLREQVLLSDIGSARSSVIELMGLVMRANGDNGGPAQTVSSPLTQSTRCKALDGSKREAVGSTGGRRGCGSAWVRRASRSHRQITHHFFRLDIVSPSMTHSI